MAVRNVFKLGESDDVLRKKSRPVMEIDGKTLLLIDDLKDTLHHVGGLGLAAPQVGVTKKLVVIDYHGEKFVLVNPEVIEAEGSVTNEEGCLSFPGIYEKVTSPEKLTVVYQDETGAPRRLSLDGFTACVFSHEIDHLNGRLLIDRVSPLKRQFLKKKIAKRAAEK